MFGLIWLMSHLFYFYVFNLVWCWLPWNFYVTLSSALRYKSHVISYETRNILTCVRWTEHWKMKVVDPKNEKYMLEILLNHHNSANKFRPTTDSITFRLVWSVDTVWELWKRFRQYDDLVHTAGTRFTTWFWFFCILFRKLIQSPSRFSLNVSKCII